MKSPLLSHRRAGAWLAAFDEKGEADYEDIKNVLQQLPLDVRRHGLLLALQSQTSASTRTDARKFVLDTLLAWLITDSSVTIEEGIQQLRKRANISITTYNKDVSETMAFLEWGKQIVKSRSVDAKDGPA